jgi:hypothetical protein
LNENYVRACRPRGGPLLDLIIEHFFFLTSCRQEIFEERSFDVFWRKDEDA